MYTINKDVVLPIVLITIAACMIVVSDTIMKKTMELLNVDEGDIVKPNSIFKVIFNPFVISAFIIGAVAKVIYSFAISTHDISRMLTAMTVMVMIGYAIVGVWQFGESFNSLKAIGIILGLISVILLSWSK